MPSKNEYLLLWHLLTSPKEKMQWGNNPKTPRAEGKTYPRGQAPSKLLLGMPFRLLKNIGNTSVA